MNKVFILLLIGWVAITATSFCVADSGNTSKWKRIYPIKDCMSFHLVYFQKNGQYYLTYPISDSGKAAYKSPYITVKSINDLSSIADLIEEQASKLCGQQLHTQGEACNTLENLDPEFIKLVQAAANAVGKSGDNCKDLTEYMELHDKIVGLDSKNPIQIEGASNVGHSILKIFANSTDSKLIDHFEACGGKSNSHKFIENLLLVETHRSCIMPKPPGILSWEEMREIAEKVAGKYKNKSILKIRDQKSNIEKEALVEITKVATMNQIKILMPDLDPENTLTSLDSFKNLKKAGKISELKDYISLVYTPNAAIEIAEKSVEGLVNKNIIETLPQGWSDDRKKQYIKKNLLPLAMAGFNECIDGPRKRSNYGHEASPVINLNFRKWQRKQFCEDNKSICIKSNKPGCNQSDENKGSINLLSMEPNISDSDIAKSCVLNAMSRTIQPVFALTISEQVNNFKNDMDLPEDLTQRFTDSSWEQFKGCINNSPITKRMFKNKKSYQPIYTKSRTNEDAFRKMSPEQFKTLYGDCTREVEQKLTRDFVEVLFISNENVATNNPYGKEIDFHGVRYPAGAVQYTQSTVKRIMDKCDEQQRLHNKGKEDFKPSPTICSPLMEIEVAKGVIQLKLMKMFKEKGLSKNRQANRVLAELNKCSLIAYNETLLAVGNPKAKPRLMDSADSRTYMESSNNFYQCVETATVDSAGIIAGVEFKKAMVKKKNTLKNYKSILKLNNKVKRVVERCFSKRLKGVGSWPKFKEFNTQGGIKDIEEECASAAVRYIVPQIMLKETNTQVQQVKADGLLDTDSDVSLVINQAADEISKDFKIRVNSKLKGNDRLLYIFGKGLERYQRKYPKASQDDYLDYFKDGVTKKVVERIHQKILTKIKDKGRFRYGMDLSQLDSSFPSGCLLDLYNNLDRKSSKEEKSGSSKPVDFDDTISQLVDGFNYLRLSPYPAFQEQMNKIAAFCRNAKEYSNAEDIKTSGLLDFVVKAQIHKKTLEAFKKMAKDSYDSDMKKLGKTSYFEKVKPFIEKKYGDMLQLIKEKIENRGNFEKMMFPEDGSPMIEFAIKNLDNVTKEGSSANKKLNQMVMAQMFKDKSKYSFASKFTEIQIVNSIGMEGYKDAQAAIQASLKKHTNIPATVSKYAKQSLNKNWTVDKVHQRFGWYELPDFARHGMINAVYDNAIIPVVKGYNATTVKNEQKKLSDKVAKHVDGWHKDGKTFKELFADEIEKETKATIKSNHKREAAGEAIVNKGEAIIRWVFW